MARRNRRSFSQEFKHQMVQLYLNGNPSREITEEYDLTESSIHNWVRQYNQSKSFRASVNLTPEQIEIIKKNKRIKELEMENDIIIII
jgi:transposase